MTRSIYKPRGAAFSLSLFLLSRARKFTPAEELGRPSLSFTFKIYKDFPASSGRVNKKELRSPWSVSANLTILSVLSVLQLKYKRKK